MELRRVGHVTRKQQTVGNLLYDLQLQYDTAGRLSRQIYPSTRYVDYGYNSNGQVNQIAVDGIIMLSSIQYHPTGTVKSWTWGNGQSVQRVIDSDGRTIRYSVGDKLQVITYDNAGRITQLHRTTVADPNTPLAGTTTTYAYDNLDRLTNNITPSTNNGYQYDLNGNRTQLTIGANNYAYTIAATSNRLNSEAGPTARTYTYNTDGSIAGNGQDTYTYYSSGRLKQVTRSATNIYALRYNGLGQFVHRTNNNNYYLYDQAQHLIGEYDSSGNAVQETVYLGDTPVLTLRPSSQNRTADNTDTATTNKATVTGTWATATTVKGFYGSNYRSHAAAASTTDKIVYTITPTATQSFRIYARWVAQTTNATNASYTIAPNTAGSTPTTVTVNQQQNGGTWNYLGSYSLNTANQLTVSLSGQGNGIVIADAIRIVPDTSTQTQNNSYLVYSDYLDTPREIRNWANQQRWTWYPELSEAFGANTPNENPATLGTFTYNLRFPGQLYDATSQLSYNYYRDYNPRTGRYIESDPIGLDAGQMSTYAYVDGKPLSGIDPYGLFDITNPADWPQLPQGVAKCIESRRWDWGNMGPQGNDPPTFMGDLGTSGNLANSAGNFLAGATGSGIGSASHATSWQHRAGSVIGQSAQQAQNGRRFGPVQATWSGYGKLAGRLAIIPTIWEGYWDIGSIAYCTCSGQQ